MMKKVYMTPVIRIHVIDGEELMDIFAPQSGGAVKVGKYDGSDDDSPVEIEIDNTSHSNSESWADDLEID